MIIKLIARFLLLGICLLVSGCAGFSLFAPSFVHNRPADADMFLDQLDKSLEGEYVHDASTVKVPGFPYLRTSRFLGAMKDRLADDTQAQEWVNAMRELASASRISEIRNLSETDLVALTRRMKLSGPPLRSQLIRQADEYSTALAEYDRSQPGYIEAVKKAVHVPDEYRTWMRVAGIYPLFTFPVNKATARAHRKIREWHQSSEDALPVYGKLAVYAPESEAAFPGVEIQNLMRPENRDALGRPRLSEKWQKQIAEAFAPVLVQDTADTYDIPGRVHRNGNQISVDGNQPAVYYYFSNCFFKGETALQVNYVFWYPARAGSPSPIIERGNLDGLTVRISLDPSGKPFMTDIMNNCGCYHFFVPALDRVAQTLSDNTFAPVNLPEAFPGNRLSLRIMSGWHQVEHISAGPVLQDVVRYALVPYGELESIAENDGTATSLFNSCGIAKGSERVEPFIFFSMGIPDVGSMRQRGHHAIKMTGRAHFDDPDLFDDNFLFK